MAPSRVTLLLVFLLYFGGYSVANYPAIAHAWWYRDDFALTETPRPNKGQWDTLKHGRPVNMLLLAAYQWEEGEQWATANILLRLLQIALHAAAATVAAALLARRLPAWSSYSGILLFLLYPFNGEAVLWRSAALNPLAALFSLLGVALLIASFVAQPGGVPTPRSRRLQRLGGLSLLALAMLTHQQAGLAGMVIWVVLLGLTAFQSERSQSTWWRATAWIVSGYLIGIGLSRLCIYLFLGPAGRAALSTDWLSKLDLALTLNRLYLLSAYYPAWLTVLHWLILGGGIAVAGWRLAAQGWRGPSWVALAALLSLLLLPYSAVLVTMENWPAWRITYLSPFLLICAWGLLTQRLATNPWGRWLAPALLGLILLGYLPLAWTNAAEYHTVFVQDLAQAQELAAWATTQPVANGAVVVATAPDYVRTWNLYDVEYMQADSKVSAFLADWTIAPLLTFFTNLTPRQQSDMKQSCVQYCLLPADKQPFHRTLLTPQNIICVCP